MTRKHWILMALACAGAVFLVAYAPDIFEQGKRGAEDGVDDDAGPDALEADGDESGIEGAASSGATSPVLFGRGRAQRVGLGGLMGRVMDFQSGKPVKGARVVAAGTGYGGEVVALQAETDDRGRFQYEAFAAGDAYTLHVSADDRQRMLAGVSVKADDIEDLGTIWLGERGALEGVVVDEDGKGIVGAVVQVHRGGSLLALLENFTDLMENLDKDARPLASTTSGAGGRFRIEDVDPGPILLVTRADGHRLAMDKAVMTSKGAAGASLRIQLRRGAPVVGRVVDESGRGVEGARVACMEKSDMNSAFFGRLFSTTDGEGRFRVESPPGEGTFAIIVAADGHPTLFTQGESGAGELRLVLLGGAQVTVRLLQKGSERPIEGARLMAMVSDKLEMGPNNMNYAAGATDHRGEMTFAARPGVLSALFFSHPDHGSGMYSPAMPAGMGASIVEGPEDATIKKPRTALVYRVSEGITITGRVLDEQGDAIAGVRISSLGGMGFGTRAVSDAEGVYVLRGQTKAVTMVLARAPGYVQEDPQMKQGQGVPEPDARGEVPFDIVMRKAASVVGRVVGPDGAPLAGARVKLGSSSRTSMVSAFMSGGGESISSKDGRFVLDGVPAGDKMRVLARMDGFLDGRSAEFAVASGAQAPDVAMQRGARFRVKVLSPDGVAVKAARVEVEVEQRPDAMQWDPMAGMRGFADVTTRADGTVVIEDVPDGSLTLTVSKAGFAGARSSLEVNREHVTADTEVRVSLREAHTLRGRVSADDKPVPKASILALSPPDVTDDNWIPTVGAIADDQGRFTLEGLPDRPLVLEISAEGFRSQEVPVGDLRGEAEVRLEPVSADAKRRLEEIEKELMGVYAKFGNVKNDAERSALLKRMQALQKEQQTLQGK